MQTNPLAKRILCYGDSNTRGRVPGKMGAQRFDITQRWTGLLQKKLGDGYEVIEEGLGARLVASEDPRPGFPEKNGLRSLPMILETHLPLDLVIVMLGTTELKPIIHLHAEQITEGMKQIIQTIKTYRILEGTSLPKILLVVPAIIDDTTEFASKLFTGGTAKAKELISTYAKLAAEEDILFLDPTDKISVDPADGIHINADNHAVLAELVYQKIK